MHKMKQAAGQRGRIIGAGYDVPGIDVGFGELLVHLARGVLVLEPMVSTRADTLHADWLRWEEDRIVQEGDPGSGDERFQEPGADHAVVDHRVPAGGQSLCRRTRGLRHDLVLVMRRGGPGRDGALLDEAEKLVSGNQGARVEELREGSCRCRFPAPGGPLTTMSSDTPPMMPPALGS
jgi:hypothetical protein